MYSIQAKRWFVCVFDWWPRIYVRWISKTVVPIPLCLLLHSTLDEHVFSITCANSGFLILWWQMKMKKKKKRKSKSSEFIFPRLVCEFSVISCLLLCVRRRGNRHWYSWKAFRQKLRSFNTKFISSFVSIVKCAWGRECFRHGNYF